MFTVITVALILCWRLAREAMKHLPEGRDPGGTHPSKSWTTSSVVPPNGGLVWAHTAHEVSVKKLEVLRSLGQLPQTMGVGTVLENLIPGPILGVSYSKETQSKSRSRPRINLGVPWVWPWPPRLIKWLQVHSPIIQLSSPPLARPAFPRLAIRIRMVCVLNGEGGQVY